MPFLPLNTAFAQGTVMQIVQSPKSMGDLYGGRSRRRRQPRHLHGWTSARAADRKFYLGDSRGHWEGNTLVIETTNFEQGFRGSNPETYKMTERLTRVDANNLRREITFEDPKTWTQAVDRSHRNGEAGRSRHMIFDSACHEGNYGMTGILVGLAQGRAGRAEEVALLRCLINAGLRSRRPNTKDAPDTSGSDAADGHVSRSRARMRERSICGALHRGHRTALVIDADCIRNLPRVVRYPTKLSLRTLSGE